MELEKRPLWAEMDFMRLRMGKALVSTPFISRYYRSARRRDVHENLQDLAAKTVLRKKSPNRRVHVINDLEQWPKPKLSLKIGTNHTPKFGVS